MIKIVYMSRNGEMELVATDHDVPSNEEILALSDEFGGLDRRIFRESLCLARLVLNTEFQGSSVMINDETYGIFHYVNPNNN